MTLWLASVVTLWLIAGLALGAWYFLLLGRMVATFQVGADWRNAVGYLALRLLIAATGFVFAAKQGALALLCALAGFLLARAIAIRRSERTR